MSSLPDIFRAVQSEYNIAMRPVKQGGIFAVKYQTLHHEGYSSNKLEQPEEYNFYRANSFKK